MNSLQMSGAQPQKQPKYVPMMIDKEFTGLYTQRNVLHDPSDLATSKFYGGRPDALWMGRNVELTNRLTLQRRPGLSAFSAATYPSAPLRAFSFELTNGTIQVLIDTGSTGNLVLSSVAATVGTAAVYTGTFPFGGSNAYVGMIFTVAGFNTGNNNGSFVCSASTTTSLTLQNAFAVLETRAATASSTGAVYFDEQNGSTVLLFGKAPGAGQTYFTAVDGVCYMGDGVETFKYTPLNSNAAITPQTAPQPSTIVNAIWNWGIAAPAVQPTVTEQATGSASVAWQASTWFSTMGIMVDPNGNAELLVGVNNSGSQFGTSGTAQKTWNNNLGGTTNDNTVVWQCQCVFGAWRQGYYKYYNDLTNFAYPGYIYYPPTGITYVQNYFPGLGINLPTANHVPSFNGQIGNQVIDNFCTWTAIGTNAGQARAWAPSTGYNVGDIVWEPSTPPATPQTPVFLQRCTTSGISAAAGTAWPALTSVGSNTYPTTTDGQLTWVSLGSATWTAHTNYTGWTSATNHAFNCVSVNVSGTFYLQVCLKSGASGTNQPVWGTQYGQQTDESSKSNGQLGDGTAVWVCVGTDPRVSGTSWKTNTIHYLPVSGFTAPIQQTAYGSAVILGTSNQSVEFVINTGVSGSGAQPTWPATGSTTVDGTVTWINTGTASSVSLSWTKGHVYAYSFKARSLADFYSIANPTLPIPPGLNTPQNTGGALPAPYGSQTGGISTASPVNTVLAVSSTSGAINKLQGFGSTDPQVDTIVIWRDADGGGSSEMFELTEIPAPKPINGVARPWTFFDFLPDTPNTTFPGLNDLISAPINNVNNPPPVSFLPMVYNFTRIWGANGQQVNFSGGPDTVTGNPNESFNPDDELPFLANVTRLVRTPQGLVTLLTDSVEFIAGGPSTGSFYSITLAPGMGMVNYNNLDLFAGETYFFSSDNQFRTLTPSLNVSRTGFPLGDQFANLPSSGISDTTWISNNVYVAMYQNGIDNAIFVADGSTGWYRCNPYQVPGGANGPEPIWSTFAAITNGAKMVQTVEVSPGIKRLLVGATTGGQQILKRDLTVFTDNGTPYDANFVMGAIMLAHPGQIAVLKFLEFDFSGVKYQPTISFLLNEISGTFTPFTMAPVFEPPSLYGQTLAPQSYSPNRYYFSAARAVARCRYIQIKVDFGTTPNPDELFNMAIFGRLMVEG